MGCAKLGLGGHIFCEVCGTFFVDKTVVFIHQAPNNKKNTN
jgi:hypothetical protein